MSSCISVRTLSVKLSLSFLNTVVKEIDMNTGNILNFNEARAINFNEIDEASYVL